jgi:hypothetical protein
VTEIKTRIIRSSDPLLGRNVGHDPRSRAFAFKAADEPLKPVRHLSSISTLDQHVGSCTCDTVLKLCTYGANWSALNDVQQLAIKSAPDYMVDDWYRETTRNDEFDGAWEPDDTGSSGTSAAKTAVRHGYAKGFQHSFSFDDALHMLAKQPIGIGVNWYSSFDNPGVNGLVVLTPTARVRGGHEFVLDELDVEHEMIGAQNSWGPSWGAMGRFYFSFDDLGHLLNEDGDAMRLIPLDQPAPEPDWDLVLAKPLKDWANSKSAWSRFTKAGKARAAAVEWLSRKGL